MYTVAKPLRKLHQRGKRLAREYTDYGVYHGGSF